MGTIDTFRDLVGNIADDAKDAFDELLDRHHCDDDWDDDWDRSRRPRSRRRPGSRRSRVVETAGTHPALADPARPARPEPAADREVLAAQIQRLSDTVESLRASVHRNAAAGPENRT